MKPTNFLNYPTIVDRTIMVGDYVRSYDFVGRDDCYAEGIVTGLRDMDGCPRYVLQVERRVLENKVCPVCAKEYFPPVNGTPTVGLGMVPCRGVQKAERPAS